MTWALIGVLIGFVALGTAVIALVYWLAKSLVAAKDDAAAARVQLSTQLVTDANAATAAAADAEKRQEQRGDKLEKELADESTAPGTGLSHLGGVLPSPTAAVPAAAPDGGGRSKP